MGIATEHPVCPFVLVGTVGGDGIVGTYIHCAKAMQRSRIWDTATWEGYTDAPDAADILVAQALLPVEATAAIIRDDLAKGYEHDLTEEMA